MQFTTDECSGLESESFDPKLEKSFKGHNGSILNNIILILFNLNSDSINSVCFNSTKNQIASASNDYNVMI